MSKTISLTILLTVSLLTTVGREAKAQSRVFGNEAVYWLTQGENLALQAYDDNRPIYRGQVENPNYYQAYYYAYYAQYYAQQAMYSNSAVDWNYARTYALYALQLEPANEAFTRTNLYNGYIYAYDAWYFAVRGR